MIDPFVKQDVAFDERDFKIEWYSGTGAGGQHRNKHQNSCRLTHLPTGIVVTSQCRSRENSFEEAKSTLLVRLNDQIKGKASEALAAERKAQVGSGMRGDKIRTYREQDDTVTDHRSGNRVSLKAILMGDLAKL